MEQQGGNLARRSRFGCITCRRKHRKCDEQRPVCWPCQFRGLECSYQVTLKWTDSHSITTFNASLREKDRSASRLANPAAHRCPPSPLHISEQRGQGRGDSTPSTTSSGSPPEPLEAAPGVEASGSSLHFVGNESTAGPLTALPRTDQRLVDTARLHNAPSVFNSSRTWMNNPHLKLTDDGRGNNGTQASGQSRHHDHEAIMGKPLSNPESDDGSEASLGQNSMDQDLPGDAVPDDRWIVDGIMRNILPQIFQETSEEIAFTYYYKRVSVCIPAYDTGHNPYRRLAFLSLSYPVLLHGILSVSTAHMYNYGRSNEALVSMRQGRALTSLRAALAALLGNKQETAAVRETVMPFEDESGVFSVLSAKEIALAAVMMQTSSVLMTGIGNVEVHIKCALEFIRGLDYLHRPARPIIGRLLVHRFSMVDVVLAHLRFRRPLAPLDFFMYQDNEQLDHEDPSFREMQGCPQRVLSFLAQVSCLSADVSENIACHTEMQAKAYSLETEMRVWGHKHYNVVTPGSHTDSISPDQASTSAGTPAADQRKNLDTVCECFYWVAHILLLRRVFLEPAQSTRVQLVRRHLFRLMDSLKTGCGPDSSLPFPFYMSAREAVTVEERDWVRRKHIAMMEVYRDRSREYMMASTEKIWAKASEAQDSRATEGVRLLDTPYEQFIRETDKHASFFMF